MTDTCSLCENTDLCTVCNSTECELDDPWYILDGPWDGPCPYCGNQLAICSCSYDRRRILGIVPNGGGLKTSYKNRNHRYDSDIPF